MISLLWARGMINRGIMEAVLQFVEPKRRDNRGSLFSILFSIALTRFSTPNSFNARTHPGALASPEHRISPGSQFRRDDNVYIHVMAVLLFLSGQNRAYSNYA
jgi:hypothetical protein